MSKKKNGFTLVELLITIGIIGILSSAIMVSLDSSRAKGRDSKRISDIKQLQLALAQYADANGAYPSDISSASLGSYITVPKDPKTNAAYKYAYYQTVSPAKVISYHLGASLENQNNVVLNDDRDCNSTAANNNGCPQPSVYSGGFNGADTASGHGNGCAGESNLYCFDVVP